MVADIIIHPARSRGALHDARFRVIRPLFAGPSSEVFEARGPRGELWAVKILSPSRAGSQRDARRFAQEGSALAALSHPNLVKVFDVGVTLDGRPYFAMERLFGETLRARLDRVGKLPPDKACALLSGALLGLAAAHRAGVVHRDIKPSNIFLAAASGEPDAERAVVLDFGIAKLHESLTDTTESTHIVGTPRYLAPEQILDGAVDGRTDVYATGLVLFEAITGRSPFDAAGAIPCMRAQICDKPYRTRTFAEVTYALDLVVDRAIQKVPAARFPSADAFADALSRVAPPSITLEPAASREGSPAL